MPRAIRSERRVADRRDAVRRIGAARDRGVRAGAGGRRWSRGRSAAGLPAPRHRPDRRIEHPDRRRRSRGASTSTSPRPSEVWAPRSNRRMAKRARWPARAVRLNQTSSPWASAHGIDDSTRHCRDDPMDKFRDECGVFGIFGHRRPPISPTSVSTPCSIAARRAPGSPPPTGRASTCRAAWAWSPTSSTRTKLAALTGDIAIGHVRYSTAGSSRIENAQPLLIECAHGQFGIGHNGNLVNATELKDDLVSRGSIFQTTTDTEVIVHLFARSKATIGRGRGGRSARRRCAAPSRS